MRSPFSSHPLICPPRLQHRVVPARLSLFWRVFAANAAVLALAATVLVVSPATISSPVALTEAVVVALGLVAMLVLNFALLRRALSRWRGCGR